MKSTVAIARRMHRGRPERTDLAHVETWVFDLDNTLYHPRVCDLFPQMDVRMNEFIADLLGCSTDEANAHRRIWFERHGTTMRGLMIEHELEPAAFLEYVHELDLSGLPASLELDAALAALPGRKLVFTNATTRHAERVLEKLGIAQHFEAVFDTVAADHRPKPDREAYARFVARHGVDPRASIMFEDMARNLEPAHAMGMTTVWVETDRPSGQPGDADEHVHYVAEDVAAWIAALAPARHSPS